MPQALGDLDAIYAYFAQDDRAAAPAFRTSDTDRTLGRRADSLMAEGFYLRYGFVPIEVATWPHRLFMSMGTLVAALGE